MLTRQGSLLVASLGLVNALLLTMQARPAMAEEQPGYEGVCGWCLDRDGASVLCCGWDPCGGEGEPECDCVNAQSCSA